MSHRLPSWVVAWGVVVGLVTSACSTAQPAVRPNTFAASDVASLGVSSAPDQSVVALLNSSGDVLERLVIDGAGVGATLRPDGSALYVATHALGGGGALTEYAVPGLAVNERRDAALGAAFTTGPSRSALTWQASDRLLFAILHRAIPSKGSPRLEFALQLLHAETLEVLDEYDPPGCADGRITQATVSDEVLVACPEDGTVVSIAVQRDGFAPEGATVVSSGHPELSIAVPSGDVGRLSRALERYRLTGEAVQLPDGSIVVLTTDGVQRRPSEIVKLDAGGTELARQDASGLARLMNVTVDGSLLVLTKSGTVEKWDGSALEPEGEWGNLDALDLDYLTVRPSS